MNILDEADGIKKEKRNEKEFSSLLKGAENLFHRFKDDI